MKRHESPPRREGVFFALRGGLAGAVAKGMGSVCCGGGASGSTSENRRPFFTDATVPASAASQGAMDIVQGFRGTRFGVPSDAVTVHVGIDGGTLASASLKMAA